MNIWLKLMITNAIINFINTYFIFDKLIIFDKHFKYLDQIHVNL